MASVLARSIGLSGLDQQQNRCLLPGAYEAARNRAADFRAETFDLWPVEFLCSSRLEDAKDCAHEESFDFAADSDYFNVVTHTIEKESSWSTSSALEPIQRAFGRPKRQLRSAIVLSLIHI